MVKEIDVKRCFRSLLLPCAGVTALLLAGCNVGVSAPLVNPDGSPKPRTYCPRGTYVPADGLIDDFEDGNRQIASVGGRSQYWYTSADSEGSEIFPEEFNPIEIEGEGYVMHAEGKTATGDPSKAWGAQFGADFLQGEFYDASRYAGIRFRAKVGPKSTPSIRFKVADVNTHPNGGVCTNCYNHFGKDLSLSTEWQQFEFFFGGMQQRPYWGDPRPPSIDARQLNGFDFTIEAGNVFDVYIDDLEFFACR